MRGFFRSRRINSQLSVPSSNAAHLPPEHELAVFYPVFREIRSVKMTSGGNEDRGMQVAILGTGRGGRDE